MRHKQLALETIRNAQRIGHHKAFVDNEPCCAIGHLAKAAGISLSHRKRNGPYDCIHNCYNLQAIDLYMINDEDGDIFGPIFDDKTEARRARLLSWLEAQPEED